MAPNLGLMYKHHERMDILVAAQKEADAAYDRHYTVQLPGEEPKLMSNVDISAAITAEENAIRAAGGVQQ